MKISSITLEVLSSLSKISEYITFNRGNDGFISISNDKKTMYAYYVLPESERTIGEFTTYKLDSVLRMIKDLNSDFEFVFEKNYIILKDKETTLKVKHAAEMKFLFENNDTNKKVDKRLLKLPAFELLGEPIISFFITNKEMQKIIKMFVNMDMDTIKFSLNKDNEIVVSASQDVETKYIEKVICKNEKSYIKPIDKVLYLSSILEVSKTFDYKIEIWEDDTFLLRSFIDVKNDNNEIEKRGINLTYIIGCKVK